MIKEDFLKKSFGNGGVQIRGSVYTTQNIYTNQVILAIIEKGCTQKTLL